MIQLHLSTGHYCVQGSSQPARCASGYYQDELGQVACKDCPIGYFCDNVMQPVVLYNNSACPKGNKLSLNVLEKTENAIFVFCVLYLLSR